MDHDPAVLADRGRPVGHGQVHGWRPDGNETPLLGRRAMAERRRRSAVQQRSRDHRRAWRRPGEGRVDGPDEPGPAPAVDLGEGLGVPDPERPQLRDAHHAGLLVQQVEPLVHPPVLDDRRRHVSPRSPHGRPSRRGGPPHGAFAGLWITSPLVGAPRS
ncbi:hypothetical protein Ae168Ps1_2064c [Pseudonocardia sp. Ae168_Ps1]|nr:hypothetical protein Ae168Ps1_2064c [Pseudonocardia sp. Ae168_Ps1]